MAEATPGRLRRSSRRLAPSTSMESAVLDESRSNDLIAKCSVLIRMKKEEAVDEGQTYSDEDEERELYGHNLSSQDIEEASAVAATFQTEIEELKRKKAEGRSRINNFILNSENFVYGTTFEEFQTPTTPASSSQTPKPKASPVKPVTVKIQEPLADVKIEDDSAATTPQPSTSMPLTVNTGVAASIAGPETTTTVERAARHEAETIASIAELRRQGKWTASRLPVCVEPPRNKTQWDFHLEELKWMANDFNQERRWKKHMARKISHQIAKQFRERELEKEKEKERELKAHKRGCATIARMIREFWQNVNKVYDYKKDSLLKSKKDAAMDKHLQFIIGEADKISQCVAEHITVESSKSPSVSKDEDANDKDFSAEESESDDERTIAKAEKQLKGHDVKKEVHTLGKEADMEIDDLLASLPPDYLKYLQGEKPDEEPKEEEAGGSGDEEDDDEDEDEEEEEEDEMKPSTSQGSPSKGSKSPSKVPVEVEEMKEEVKDDMAESDDEPLIKKIKTTPDPPKEVEETAGDEGEGPSNTGQEEGDEAERDGDRDDSQTRDEKVKLDGVDYAKLKSDNQDEREQELSHIADEALKLLPKGHTLETTQVKTPVPYLLRGTLREYQMVGLDWLVTLYDKNLNGILADEMGLGKTIQTVALLAHLACSERIWGPHLIVVPTSVILNWEMEFKKWCPSLKILTYFGSVKERAEKRKGWMKPNHFHVCITSYKVVTTDIRSFKMRSWQYLILDEAQNIKNWKSERWQKLLNVRARRRLLLTGTPLQNHLMELWSLLHFLMPAIFASHEDFKDWFSNPLTGMMEGNVEFNRGLLDRLHKVLRPFILRRLKADVEKQLPQKTEKTIRCPLSKRQRYLYEDFMSQRETRDNLRSGSMMSVLNIVMQLRKVCNHPNLFALRPVQSPFVMDPIEIGIPSCCLNIIDYESLGDPKIPDIPPALDLRKRMAGWRSGVQSRKPLIEEMLVTDAEPSLPVLKPSTIPGNYFKFERPLVEKPRNSQEFINGGGSPVAYKNRLMEGGVPGRTVNGNGERAYQGHSSESLLSTASPTSRVRPSMMGWKGAAGAPPPAPIREGGATPSISATSAYSTDSRRGSMFGQQPPMQKTGRPPPQMPPTMRTSTISFPSGPPPRSNGMTPDRPGVKRFTETTGEGGREYMEYPPPNPPLKKRRLRPENIYTGEYVDCLTPEARADKEETRDRRFRLAQDRFGLVHEPILSFQLISALWREVRTSRRRAGEWAPTWWKAEREDIQDELSSQTVQLAKGFSVFVDAAYASVAPRIKPLAAIRYMEKNEDEEQCADLNNAYGRFKDRVVQAEAFDFAKYRKGQVELPDFVHNASLARRLQFPEQRLIQYDCGKLQVLARLLRELYIYKHRVLIFTQMSKMLDTLQDFLSYHGYIYYRLDGSTPIEARHAMMERFNADNKVFCFILSTRSGGVGVNLTGADTVIFYDSDWNPTMDAQAQDRCHRIGQTRNVTIYRLISERTIEENILKKANQKKLLGELAIDDAGFTPDFFKQKENLRDLFDVEGGKNVMDDALEEEEEDEGARPSTSKGPSKQDKQEDVEKAMAMVEDDDDVAAARAATKEAVDVDNHEFDEKMVDGGDERYLALLDAMMPIERKAIAVLEHLGSADFQLEMDEAQAQITQKQAEWVQAHQRLMRDEEEVEGGGYDPMLSSLATDEARKRPRNMAKFSAPARQSARIVESTTSQSASRNRLAYPSPGLTPSSVPKRRGLRAAEGSPTPHRSLGKRKPGRPKKLPPTISGSSAIRGDSDEDEDFRAPAAPPPRAPAPVIYDSQGNVIFKRGRGRPRKHPLPAPETPASPTASTPGSSRPPSTTPTSVKKTPPSLLRAPVVVRAAGGGDFSGNYRSAAMSTPPSAPGGSYAGRMQFRPTPPNRTAVPSSAPNSATTPNRSLGGTGSLNRRFPGTISGVSPARGLLPVKTIRVSPQQGLLSSPGRSLNPMPGGGRGGARPQVVVVRSGQPRPTVVMPRVYAPAGRGVPSPYPQGMRPAPSSAPHPRGQMARAFAPHSSSPSRPPVSLPRTQPHHPSLGVYDRPRCSFRRNLSSSGDGEEGS